MRKKQFSYFSFQNFFGFWVKNFSNFWPKNFKKFSKLPSTCPEEQFVAWNFFLKFWIVLDFLQKPSAWFSKFYLRVQSKNCGKNRFFVFFPDFFRFLSENFSHFWPKNFEKISKLPSTFLEEQFVAWIFFLKFWIILDFLQKPSAWFSKFYLRVQSKKCGRNSFLIFFQIFFGFWVKNFSDFRPKNFKKLSKLPSARPEEHFVTLIFFSKVLNRFGFSAETFGMVLRNLSKCPE